MINYFNKKNYVLIKVSPEKDREAEIAEKFCEKIKKNGKAIKIMGLTEHTERHRKNKRRLLKKLLCLSVCSVGSLL